jgi:hypothetical protein
MSAALHLEVDDRQREILLRGLRFVRSSRMMELRDMSDMTEDERREELAVIRALYEQLDNKKRKPEPAAV